MSTMDFTVETGSEDVASSDAMMGSTSTANHSAARGAGKGTATRALVMLWFLVLFLYWGFAALFRRKLS